MKPIVRVKVAPSLNIYGKNAIELLFDGAPNVQLPLALPVGRNVAESFVTAFNHMLSQGVVVYLPELREDGVINTKRYRSRGPYLLDPKREWKYRTIERVATKSSIFGLAKTEPMNASFATGFPELLHQHYVGIYEHLNRLTEIAGVTIPNLCEGAMQASTRRDNIIFLGFTDIELVHPLIATAEQLQVFINEDFGSTQEVYLYVEKILKVTKHQQVGASHAIPLDISIHVFPNQDMESCSVVMAQETDMAFIKLAAPPAIPFLARQRARGARYSAFYEFVLDDESRKQAKSVPLYRQLR